jgi:site-specific recombinase XerD
MHESSKPILKHIPDFLDYCEIEKGLSSNTQLNYQRYLHVFAKWLHHEDREGTLPHQLTGEDVWNYRLFLSRKYKTRSGEYLKKITQHYYLVALRALLDYFTDRDITSLPSGKVKLPRDSRVKSVKFLTLEQVEKLLETPNVTSPGGLRDRAIMETLFSTGLRIAELVALNRKRVNFKDSEGLELTVVGKGDTPRTVYFSARTLRWLKKYLETRTDMDEALFVHYRSKGGTDSRRLSARSMEHIVKKNALLAGLPVAATPHTLRHSYATDLLMQGVDLRTVQEFLGHKNIATTQIYTHVTNKRLRDIHKKFHGGNKLNNEG